MELAKAPSQKLYQESLEKALKAEEMYAKAGNRAYLASTLQAMEMLRASAPM